MKTLSMIVKLSGNKAATIVGIYNMFEYIDKNEYANFTKGQYHFIQQEYRTLNKVIDNYIKSFEDYFKNPKV